MTMRIKVREMNEAKTSDLDQIERAFTGNGAFSEDVGVVKLDDGRFVVAVENSSDNRDVSWHDYEDNYRRDNKGYEMQTDFGEGRAATKAARQANPEFVKDHPSGSRNGYYTYAFVTIGKA